MVGRTSRRVARHATLAKTSTARRKCQTASDPPSSAAGAPAAEGETDPVRSGSSALKFKIGKDSGRGPIRDYGSGEWPGTGDGGRPEPSAHDLRHSVSFAACQSRFLQRSNVRFWRGQRFLATKPFEKPL
jgi:hypothetical protein